MVGERLGDLLGDGGLVALADGERADAPQSVERVVGRGARAVEHGVRPDRVEHVGRSRRSRRAWRRCGRRCPWSPSAARGRHRGRAAAVRSGVANVESTIVYGPTIAPISSRSTRSSRGFDGVSVITSIVRPGTHGGGEGAGFGAVDEGDVDAEAGARALQERRRAGVELALGDDVVAGGAQGEHGGRDRAHARREGEGVLGALELGDRLLERAHRRVGVAAVEVARAHPGGPLAGVVEAIGLPGAVGPQRDVETRALVVRARR